MKITPEFQNGIFCAGRSSYMGILSIPPLMFESAPGQMHPVRDFDLGLLENFFDHSGNVVNGCTAATVVLVAASLLERFAEDEPRKHATFLGFTAGAIATVSTGVNVAYEAGAPVVPGVFDKPDNLPFDAADAAYGSIAGIVCAAAFAVGAFSQKIQNARS